MHKMQNILKNMQRNMKISRLIDVLIMYKYDNMYAYFMIL